MKFTATSLLMGAAAAMPVLNQGAVEQPSQEVLSGAWGRPIMPPVLPLVDSASLQALIDPTDLTKGAKALYGLSAASIGQLGHRTRTAGSKGHNLTVKYINSTFNKLSAFYNVTEQQFEYDEWELKWSFVDFGFGPEPQSRAFVRSAVTPFKSKVSLQAAAISGPADRPESYTDVAGKAVLASVNSSYGYTLYAEQAAAQGASALILSVNDKAYDEVYPYLRKATDTPLYTLLISQATYNIYSARLAAGAIFNVSVLVDAVSQKVNTTNLIAQTVLGDQENVVALGSHTDSVGEGPGINDDGSGTIALLEVAKQLTNFNLTNAVRFCFWTGEEEGLLGSWAYANSLNETENAKIRLFMDYDMIASPNWALQIYEGDDVDFPAGSGEIKELYQDFYTSKGYNYTFTPFDGRSDYVGFIKHGIPAGGVFTGAEGLKTAEEAAFFGGDVGMPYDACYHLACDNTTNVNMTAWLLNTQLIAHSVATYGSSLEGFPARTSFKSEEALNQEEIEAIFAEGF